MFWLTSTKRTPSTKKKHEGKAQKKRNITNTRNKSQSQQQIQKISSDTTGHTSDNKQHHRSLGTSRKTATNDGRPTLTRRSTSPDFKISQFPSSFWRSHRRHTLPSKAARGGAHRRLPRQRTRRRKSIETPAPVVPSTSAAPSPVPVRRKRLPRAFRGGPRGLLRMLCAWCRERRSATGWVYCRRTVRPSSFLAVKVRVRVRPRY